MEPETFDLNYTDIHDNYSNNATFFIYYHAYKHTVSIQKTAYKLISYLNYLLSDWSIVDHNIKYSYLFYKNIRYIGNYSTIITKLQGDIRKAFPELNINFNYISNQEFFKKFDPLITNTIQHLNFTYKFKFYEDYIYYGKLDNIIQTLKIMGISISDKIDHIFDHNGIISYLKTTEDINSSDKIIILESGSHVKDLIIRSLNLPPNNDKIGNLDGSDREAVDQNSITIEPHADTIQITFNEDFWDDKLYLGNSFIKQDINTYILINNDLNLQKFNNMLKSFNALHNRIFIFNKFRITRPNILETDKVHLDVNIDETDAKMYELIGYNQLKLVVYYNHSSNIWLDLLSLGFLYHFNDCAWTKYPYNYIDINTLNFSLGMVENKRMVINNKIEEYDFKNPIISFYDKKNIVLNNLKKIIAERLIISIYINALSPIDKKFKGTQLHYSDNINSIWISFKRPEYENSYITINILWNWVETRNTEMRTLLENILMTNIKYCYNVKAILLQLRKNQIMFNPETFEGDVLLAYWIYNPRFYDYYDELNNTKITPDLGTPYVYDMYPCGYKYRYELRNIITNFIKNAPIYIDPETLYTIYPLILCHIMIPKLHELNLYAQYQTELKVNYIFVNMEYNGITVNIQKLNQLEMCMGNFLKKNIPIVLRFFKNLIPALNDQWLILKNSLIEYNYQHFIPLFKIYASENGYIEPYLEVNERVPKSWKYFKAFIVRNSNIPGELKSKLKLLQLILQMKYIYETKINELKENLKPDGKIHPCINPIGYNFGRLLTNSPNIHYAPNTETTQWGKYYRRCLQSKPGYKLIKADWKSQELYTLALLLNDPTFTRTLAGDFHINTGKMLFSNQNIQINNIRQIDMNNLEIGFTCENEEVVKGISIYNNDFYHTISQIINTGYNLYQIKLSNETASNFQIQIGDQITYITNQQRQISKRLNFGLMYSEPVSRLQEHLQIDAETLQRYIDTWWLIYPKITEFIRDIRQKTNINGYAETFLGRRMFFPELLENSDNMGYNAEKRDLLLTFVNSGTAVDLLKQSIIMITELIEVAQCDAHIVHTLHDEIIIEVADADAHLVKILVNDAMTQYAIPEFLRNGINIGADIDVCFWWDKCKESEITNNFRIEDDDCPNIKE